MVKGPDFSSQIKQILAKRAGQTCSNPDCRKTTSGPHSKENKAVNIGEACHINGARNKTARYNANMTDQERGDISNGIWLCRECARKIDLDETKYPVGLLIQWKKDHEFWIDKGKPGRKINDRVKSTLEFFRDTLTPWLYHYAYALAGSNTWVKYFGHSGLPFDRRFRKEDIPKLEDIFGIRSWDASGNLIRGSEARNEEMFKYPMDSQSVSYSISSVGLRAMQEIEESLTIFPGLLNEVSEGVAKIKLLSKSMKDRLAELDKWEKEHKPEISIKSLPENLCIRSNLRFLGQEALNIIIAIDAELLT